MGVGGSVCSRGYKALSECFQVHECLKMTGRKRRRRERKFVRVLTNYRYTDLTIV